MDYSEVRTPFVSDEEIKKAADKIRVGFSGNKIPVDIEKILEKKYKISVIPLPGLHVSSGFDSFITIDWKNIYIDNERYLDDSSYKRVRFSLAHELGHFILHKELFESWAINSLEDYYNFYRDVPNDQYSFLETQANKFAGYLLVPRNIFEKEREIVLEAKKKVLFNEIQNEIDDSFLEDYVAEDLADIFNVSAHTIQVCSSKNLKNKKTS